MQIVVSKSWQFQAAHKNRFHPGECSEIHGHTYTVRVWAKRPDGQLCNDASDEHGMVVDFRALSAGVKKHIIDVFDHRLINEVIIERGFTHIEATTVEELAKHFLTVLHNDGIEVFKVRVYEGATAYAEASL